MTSPRRSCGGFSLLEILVAFVILAIAMGVLMRIFSTSMRNVDAAERYAEATLLAESRLASVGSTIPLNEGETTGEVGKDYRWRVRVARDAAEDMGRAGAGTLFGLYRVEVTVSWGGADGKPRAVQLATLRTGASQ